MSLYVALFSFILIICEYNVVEIVCDELGDENLTTIQIIRKYGYPGEKHTVETADGYLLEMHRIPRGIANNTNLRVANKKKIPVLIQHGLLGSSADFVLLGPQKGLAFLLADLGFDVWLGNLRGNTYSRAHVDLSPDERKFWNFGWHESGIYDLPAEIDYISNETKIEKIIYIGHSMGTTAFFVMTSILPKFNDKIELSLLMAPVAYVKNIKSPVVRGLLPLAKIYKIIDELVSHGEFLPHSTLFQRFSEFFCRLNRIEERLCESIIFMITGADPKEFDENILRVFLGHYPAGYSVKGVYHYSELVDSGEFREYDYGTNGNIEHYNSQTPPDYNVSSITTEMNFYTGLNDYLSTPADVKRLAKQLPTLRKIHVVNNTKFSHIDFLIAKDVKKLLYNIMIKDIQAHLNSH